MKVVSSRPVSWHVQWWRMRPYRCSECNRLRWLDTLKTLRPRRIVYGPPDVLSAVYFWQFLWGPLVVARWVSCDERPPRIDAHNAYVRDVEKLPLGL